MFVWSVCRKTKEEETEEKERKAVKAAGAGILPSFQDKVMQGTTILKSRVDVVRKATLTKKGRQEFYELMRYRVAP